MLAGMEARISLEGMFSLFYSALSNTE